MGEPDLFEAFVDMANSKGEDYNDGDEWPGWMTGEWVSDCVLEITYTNPEASEPLVQRFRVEKVS